jgi:hypothetical protein
MNLDMAGPDASDDKKHPGFLFLERVLILPDKNLYK